MPNIMKNWPEWAWVSRHAEKSANDTLVLTGPANDHVFPQLERPSYCCRSWGPQEYIQWRIKILTQEAEDLQKLIRLFEMPEVQHSEMPLIAKISNKSSWQVKGRTPEVVDCEEVEFTEEERNIINEEIAPIVVGKKQAKKAEKREEVAKVVAYFLRFVCCCEREIPVVALPKILIGFKIKISKHLKQRDFLKKLTELGWIDVLKDYQHPAKNGGSQERKARTYGIGEAMISKFPSYKKKREEKT